MCRFLTPVLAGLLPALLLPADAATLRGAEAGAGAGGARPSSAKTDSFDTVWRTTKDWLEENGAYIHEDLALAVRNHGGAPIRGLVSTRKIPWGTKIATIPPKVWVSLDKFPDLRASDITSLSECSPVTSHGAIQHDYFKIVVALAIETRKGAGSFFNDYIKRLPTLEEFKSFHPKFSSDAVLRDFEGLPFVHTIEEQRVIEKEYAQCLLAWQRTPSPPSGLMEVDSEALALAAVRAQSRMYDEKGLVPLDFANCVAGRTNAWYIFNENGWEFTTKRDIAAGEEITEDYCKLDNAELLWSWGVFLEGNPIRIKTGNPVSGSLPDPPAQICGGAGGAGLRATVEKALERPSATELLSLTSAVASVSEEKDFAMPMWPGQEVAAQPVAPAVMVAPRCKPATIANKDKGIIRCSLARLAYEQCGAFWANEGLLALWGK